VRFEVIGIDKSNVDAFFPVSAVGNDERAANTVANNTGDGGRGKTQGDEWL